MSNSYEALREEAASIQAYVETAIQEDTPVNEIEARGDILVVYIGRTGKMLADAKYLLSTTKRSEVREFIKELMKEGNISAKVQNAYCDSLCAEEMHLVDWLDRLNRACTHQYEWCRTRIGKYKAELAASY